MGGGERKGAFIPSNVVGQGEKARGWGEENGSAKKTRMCLKQPKPLDLLYGRHKSLTRKKVEERII